MLRIIDQSGTLPASTSAAYLEPYESYGYPFSRTSSRQSHRSGYGEVFPAASQPNTTSFESPAYIGTAEQYEQHSYYLPSTSASSAPNLYFDPHAGNVEDTCSYQILRLRSKLENILPSLPGNTADIPFSHTGPFLNTRPPTSQQLGLDQILDVTEELIGVINQLRVETSGPQGLGLHEETLLGMYFPIKNRVHFNRIHTHICCQDSTQRRLCIFSQILTRIRSSPS